MCVPLSVCLSVYLLVYVCPSVCPSVSLYRDLCMEQVAQHLAATYGDRAYSVAKLAKLTGQRWPIVGSRLHQEFPYLEAEVGFVVL